MLFVTGFNGRKQMDDITKIVVAYNNEAQKVFFSLYEKFKVSVEKLDRGRDDNVFQQQQGKYLQTLKYQLQSLALEFLGKDKSSNYARINKKLADAINIYLNEFRQKSKSL
jgi:hypothetical protein